MDFDINKITNEAIKAINDKVKNLKHLNIIVAGKTGVGKSTLINSVFRENLAETGIGRPVTKSMRLIEKPDYPLSVYDTPGFELGKAEQNNVKAELLKVIHDGMAANDVNKAIHCIWYCINTASNRIEPEEIRWLKEFSSENKYTRVPIIVVLTQACPKKKALEMSKVIEAENLDIISVVPVLAQNMDFDGEFEFKAYGLDTLIEVMQNSLPDELCDTLQNVQIASLKAKKKRAHAIVAAAVTSAFGEGFAPVPFADAAMLVPTQVAMIASITAVFGMDISKGIISAFVSSTLGAGGATVLGRTVVSNILKFLPGVGTVVGGTISGATAGLITTALGESYIQLMVLVYNGEISKDKLVSKEGRKELENIFKNELKKKR